MSSLGSATYRRDIDGLRAFAVLSVLVHHSFPGILSAGFVGVDVFFVISGFLITGIIRGEALQNRFSYVEFYWRRCRRIIPALAVVLLATWIIGALILTAPEFGSLARHIMASDAFASNMLLWHQVGYFDTSADLKPLLHLWSLGIEEQYYLIWPAILIGLMWLTRGRRTMAPLLLILGAASLGLSAWLAAHSPEAGFYLLPSRFWELLAGGVLAIFAVHPEDHGATRASSAMRTSLSWGGAVLLAIAFVMINRATPYPSVWALLPVLGTVALIAAGPQTFVNRVVLGNRVAVWFGLISYPLYLWHWPLLSFFKILSLDTDMSVNAGRFWKLGLDVLAIGLAYATYRWVELPSQRAARRVAPDRASRLRGIRRYLTPLAAIGAVALVTTAFDGLPFRHASAGSASAKQMLEGASLDALLAYRDRSVRCSGDVATLSWCWTNRASDAGGPSPRPAAEPQVAVFGDSHAQALYPGLTAAMPESTVLLIGQSGCAPFTDLRSHRVESPDTCLSANRIALAHLVAASSVHTVILVGRGPMYISGVGFGKEEEDMRWKLTSGTGSGAEDTESLFRDGSARLIETLLRADKRVVFVIDVPELEFAPELCVLARPFGIRPLRSPCGVSRDVFDRRNARYRAIVASLAQRFPAMQVVDAADPLCGPSFCDAMRDGKLLYQDGNHLSLDGSLLVGRSLVQALSKRTAFAPQP